LNLSDTPDPLWITRRSVIVRRNNRGYGPAVVPFEHRGRLTLNLKIKLNLRIRVSIKKYFQKGWRSRKGHARVACMREDMQYISGVLDELEAIVQDASGVPMRKGRAVVDRSDLVVMLDELRASLPRELAEAEALRRECEVMVAAAEEEGRRIVEEAHHRANALVPETELCRRTDRRAGEIIDGAQRYAEEVSSGSEIYRDRVMGQLEDWFQDSLVSVEESRQELSGVPVHRPTPQPEPKPAEEQDNDRGWRASSA
jgi:vacuolar-type H+-ATPase subunit H